jgi:hypothetical protein
MNPRRAGCAETRKSGSESGPRKRTGPNPDTPPRPDPYTDLKQPGVQDILIACVDGLTDSLRDQPSV